MRLWLTLAGFVALIGPTWAQTTTPQVGFPSEQSGNYSEHCAGKWTKRGVLDHEMYAYCMRQEAEGHDDAVSLIEKYAAVPGLNAIVQNAIAKWSKRGMRQDDMVAYEIKGQIDAFLDLQYMEKHSKFSLRAAEQCAENSWGPQPDYEQVLYCYKRKMGLNF